MSASLDHMGAFAEQLRREVYPLRDLHPALADAWSQTERSPAAGLALSPAGQAF